MSYAIVRNEKLTRAEINGKCTHNDRKAKNHTNKDIDSTRMFVPIVHTKDKDGNNLEWDYKKQVKKLEKENNHLHKIIDKFYETVAKFIVWICHKFGIGESKELIKNFQLVLLSTL